jgi:hypothetical protein
MLVRLIVALANLCIFLNEIKDKGAKDEKRVKGLTQRMHQLSA